MRPADAGMAELTSGVKILEPVVNDLVDYG